MPFCPTFDVKRCLAQEEVNMHNLLPELAIPDEEMSTEVDIALLTSLESEVASTVSCSADWVSEHSVAATPTEMRVHAPLPVWPSDKLMESSEVGRLPLVRKRRAKLSVQVAGDLCEATTQENCLVYAAHRAWARRLVKRKSSSSLTVFSQACDGGDEDSVHSSLHAVSHPDQGSPSPRSRRRHRHQPQSQTPSSNSSNYRPPPASLASSSTKSHQPASRISHEHSLPVRTPPHTDSLVTMPFGRTFDVKRCLAQEELNMHNLLPELAIPDEEMSTKVDIALLTSLESEVASTVSCSADWVSEQSVAATPAEMRMHAPLPVWRSDKLMESSEVGRLPLVRKRRAKLSVQAAGDLCEATTQENCLVYAAHRAWPRLLVKRKSNMKWPASSVTRSYETEVSIICKGGDDVVAEVAVIPRRRRFAVGRFLRQVCRQLFCCLISEEKDFNENSEIC
ncbi:hypothetical protein AAHC03_021092 [Spirometra sp. Aus1]